MVRHGDFGRCLRPALPMNRVGIRLSLTVGIAIALAGCKSEARQLFDDEASATEYVTIGLIIDNGGPGADEARAALNDGRLTDQEYEAVWAIRDAYRDAQDAEDKRRLIQRYGRDG